MLAKELKGGEIICLSGDLGGGKTTFTQGILKGLGVKGPYTSPTFAIMKQYEKHGVYSPKNRLGHEIRDIFHIDAYRICTKDILELGFKDFAGQKNSITIIEWPEKIQNTIPSGALWITFIWKNEKERQITLSVK